MPVVNGRHRPEPEKAYTANNNSSSVIEVDHYHNGAQMVALNVSPQTIVCDEVSVNLKYVGYAAPGSDTIEGRAAEIWRIAELTDTGIRWAYVEINGVVLAGRPMFAWDDRANLAYA